MHHSVRLQTFCRLKLRIVFFGTFVGGNRIVLAGSNIQIVQYISLERPRKYHTGVYPASASIARAPTTTIVTREMTPSSIISILARLVRGMTSAALNAAAVEYPRNR